MLSFRIVLLTLLLTCHSGITRGQQGPGEEGRHGGLDQFAWMAGTWNGQLDVGDGYALAKVQYLEPRAGVMLGSFSLTREERTLVIELFTLVDTERGIEMRIRHFGSQLDPWEKEDPIVLSLEAATDSLYTFRNHVHDSPRWSYLQPVDANRFRARSEIYDKNGTESVIDILYTRASQAPREVNASSLSPELASFKSLIGSWEASGTGFRTVLTYRPGVTGRAVHVDNQLYGTDGKVMMTYEGSYTWDPDGQTIVFTTVSSTGERHTGKVTGQDRLWHMANVAGGSIEGYRSVIEPKGGDSFEYRAVYRADATENEVLEGLPLTYTRLPE